jgi:hypothetical protein
VNRDLQSLRIRTHLGEILKRGRERHFEEMFPFFRPPALEEEAKGTEVAVPEGFDIGKAGELRS